MMSKRGQIATEFLANHLILISSIITVILAFVFFGIMNTSQFARVECDFDTGVMCERSSANGGHILRFELRNHFGKTIFVPGTSESNSVGSIRYEILGGLGRTSNMMCNCIGPVAMNQQMVPFKHEELMSFECELQPEDIIPKGETRRFKICLDYSFGDGSRKYAKTLCGTLTGTAN